MRDVRVWRSAAVGLVILTGGFVALAITRVGRGSLTQAFSVLQDARPGWLLVGGLAYGAGLLASAAAWSAGLRACGGSPPYRDVAGRYLVGSLVNSFAPAGLGGVVRIGLLSRTLPGADPLLRTCGVATTIGVARTFGLGALVFAAAAVGGVPLWPAPVLLAVVVVLLALCVRFSTRLHGRVGAVLEVFRSPRAAVDAFAWIACAWALRIAGTVAVVLALGVGNALPVAVVLVAAVALSGVLPLTPGNFGMGAGAATLALHGTGVGVGTALALGLALQAVETCTGVTCGVAGAAVVSTPGTLTRRLSLASVTVLAAGLAATVGFTTVGLV